MGEEKRKHSLIISNDSKEKSAMRKNDSDHKAGGYKIYNYFKRHPSFLVAVLSAAVAMVSLILNYVSFLYINTYLAYFDISVDVQINSPKFLYFVAITALFCASLLLFQSFISRTFEAYMPYERRFLLYWCYMWSIRKEIKLNKRLIKKATKRANTINVSEDNRSELEAIKLDLRNLQRKNEEITQDYISIKNDIRKQRIKYIIIISISCFVAWMIITVVCFLMFLNSLTEWHLIIPTSMAISLLFVLCIALENWFLYCLLRINFKQIKIDSNSSMEEQKLSYDNFPKMPLEILFFGRIKDVFSDAACRSAVLAMISLLIVLIPTTVYAGKTNAEKQKEFFVVQENDAVYAVIYNNGTMMILEKAEFSDNSITIDTTEQMTVDADGVLIKKYI